MKQNIAWALMIFNSFRSINVADLRCSREHFGSEEEFDIESKWKLIAHQFDGRFSEF